MIRVGLAYDLKEDYLAQGYGPEEAAEFDRPDTIEALETALATLGFAPIRIGNIRELVARLSTGERWDLVFNIAEGMHGLSRESQVPALLEAYQIPYTFSDPLVLAVTHDKAMAKRIVRSHGIPTPDFTEVTTPADAGKVDLPFPLFCKPVAEGSGKGVAETSRVGDREGLLRTCRELLERFRQPVLVETFLPGREFTVGLCGTAGAPEVLAAMEVHFKSREATVYSHHTKTNYEELVEYSLPRDKEARKAVEVSLAAWRALSCRDVARFDIRLDGKDVPHFLEVNALPGLNPTHSDLPIMCRMKGIGFTDLIARIMDAFLARYPHLAERR